MVCSLHVVKQEIDVNEARYKLFTKPLKPPPPPPLPPTKDPLHLHFQRANYQCLLWKRFLNCDFLLPNPTDHG